MEQFRTIPGGPSSVTRSSNDFMDPPCETISVRSGPSARRTTAATKVDILPLEVVLGGQEIFVVEGRTGATRVKYLL